jgi:hypothetical protein
MTYWYVATPYSKYPGGLEAAFNLALDTCGLLIRFRVPCFSPIAHTHPIAIRCGIDPLDHNIWLPADEPLMESAHGVIMVKAESWEQSYGMGEELKAFQRAAKPVIWMDPGVLPLELLPA